MEYDIKRFKKRLEKIIEGRTLLYLIVAGVKLPILGKSYSSSFN